MSAVEDGTIEKGKSRWYDIDSTVRTAINMLENSPEVVQKSVAKEMAQMVIDSITKEEDEDDGEEEV